MKMWPSQYLNFSLMDPKKRTQLNWPKSWPLETEIINGYCFKRLSFGKFPTQQLIKFFLNQAKIISEKHNIPYVGQEASFRYKMTLNVSFSDYIIYSSIDVASFNPLCFQKPLFFFSLTQCLLIPGHFLQWIIPSIFSTCSCQTFMLSFPLPWNFWPPFEFHLLQMNVW